MTEIHERFYGFDQTELRSDADGMTLEGYAAVFNQATDIQDFLGSYRETVLPGAFTRTLTERTPVLQFDHGHHPMIGSVPIGAIRTLEEDSHGLHVVARLHSNWLIEPVREAIESQAVDGMSFRFSVPKGGDEWAEDDSSRQIRDLDLFELGPVVFPAYPTTTVGVRDTEDLLPGPETESSGGEGEQRDPEGPRRTTKQIAAARLAVAQI